MHNTTLKIGVSGYIGSGKSVGSAALALPAGDLIVADSVAKELMKNDRFIHRRLRETFGNEVVGTDTIFFDRLGGKVFSSREELDKLNAIVHPPLLKRLRDLLNTSAKRKCVLDAALIPFWGIEDWFDLRIWVRASVETRVRRLMARDSQSR
ncbi:MAG: dephospho-CoA kinase, partial [Chitinivibrionales bacterium]|nr:dephospho-CoA kinase [Chitinivibrionales bacterium]MBD3357068.1 dephospho-CoA kinase [Chitinivibrionales bacterium]